MARTLLHIVFLACAVCVHGTVNHEQTNEESYGTTWSERAFGYFTDTCGRARGFSTQDESSACVAEALATLRDQAKASLEATKETTPQGMSVRRNP